MRYRDERDALRHRADVLSDELRAAEQRLAQTEQQLADHQRKDAEEEKRLAELRAEVERLRRLTGESPQDIHQKRKRGLAVALGLLTSLMFAGGFVGYLLVSTSPEPSDVSVEASPPTAVVADAPPTAAPQRAFWGGEVIAVTGGKAGLGDGCLVEATLGSGSRVHDLMVRCGQATLFTTTEPTGDGMIQHDAGHAELVTVDGQLLHLLRYNQTGRWSGPRPQIVLDSQRHRGRIFHEGAESWSVTVHLASLSFPRPGPALSPEPSRTSNAPWRHLVATRTALDGAAPTPVADAPTRCELSLQPMPLRTKGGKDLDCRVTLRCGATLLYGAASSGFNHFNADDDTVVDDTGSEQDTDPKLTLDLQSNSLVIEDGPLGATWKASFSLAPPERCVPDGAWTGQRGGGKHRKPTALSVEHSALALIVDEGETGPRFSLSTCASHALAFEGDDAPVLHTGPGWSTLGGYGPDAKTPWAFLRVATKP